MEQELSQKELLVYNYMHLTVRETAFELDMCDKTVKFHITNIYRKLPNLIKKTTKGMKYNVKPRTKPYIKSNIIKSIVYYPNNYKYYYKGDYLSLEQVIKLVEMGLKVINNDTKEVTTLENLQLKKNKSQSKRNKSSRQESHQNLQSQR